MKYINIVLFALLFMMNLYTLHTETKNIVGGASTSTVPSIIGDPEKMYPTIKNPKDPRNIGINISPGASDTDILVKSGVIHEIDGFQWFHTQIGQPVCVKETSGMFGYIAAKDGVADQWIGCMKDVSNQYSWQVIR